MRVVHKFFLDYKETVTVPIGAKILSAGKQDDRVVVWAEVDPSPSGMEVRQLHVLGTGWHYGEQLNLRFIQTIQSPLGLVWHIFEEIK
jgi:hypothetical protein